MVRKFVTLDQADSTLLSKLATRLGYTEADAIRYGIRAATVHLSLPLNRPMADKLGNPHRINYRKKS
jgi:hypothetical protein